MSKSDSTDKSFSSDISPENLEIAAQFIDKGESQEWEAIECGKEAITAALQAIVKAGKEEPPLLYLKGREGSPLLQYDARLMRRALYIADTGDDEAIYRIGLGYDFGFCSPEETALLEAQAFAHKSDDSELLKVWEGVIERLSPESVLRALFALGDENCPEDFKDYFRSDDLAKETAYFNAELAARVRQIAFPPFKNETDEELAKVGLAWHLDDPEIARWRGVEPIAPFTPVYVFDVSGDTAKAADWLLEEDFEVINYLIQLRAEKPVAFSRLAEQFKAKAKLKKADLELLLKLKAVKEPAPEVLLEDTPRIKEEAAKIIAADQGFLYCVNSWTKSHTGDLPVGEFLFMQRGVQCVANTKGIHCHLKGPSATGKSDAAKQYARRTPEKYLIDATISPKLLFYKASTMPEGCTVILDDEEIVEPILGVYKKATTNFQEGASLETVLDSPGGKGKTAYKMKMKPRIAFINTSVKNQAEDQARDRGVDLEVYSSPARIEEIKGYMASMFIDPQIAKETNEIAICKAVIDDMASHLWVLYFPTF